MHDHTTPAMPLIDAVHLSRQEFDSISQNIENLAYAFRRVGQTQPADELLSYAERIQDMSNIVSKAFSDDLGQQVALAEENSRSMFAAVLAGVEIVAMKS
jgi:hypothetical protein